RQGRGRGEIGMAPDRVDRVAPQDELTRRVAASGDRRGDGGAGGLLGLGRDRVFEIENQRSGRTGGGLFVGARVRARGKQADWAWFGFWAELVMFGRLAIAGGYFASHGGGSGDYVTGLVLGVAAIALAFLRLKRRFDGAPTRWDRVLLVDDMRNLVLVIAVF